MTTCLQKSRQPEQRLHHASDFRHLEFLDMRILYINHYAGSPKHGMEYRPHYMARHWARMGNEVTVIAASVSHIRYKTPQVSSEVTEEMIDGVRYLWIKTPPYNGNGVRRAINMSSFVWRLFRIRHQLIERFSPDAVIASSTYTWDIFPAHAIARQSRARLVYEVHDLWPLSPMEIGGMSPWNPFIMSLQWGENFACRNADAVISMLPLADAHLRDHGMAQEKFHYIPNGIELAEWDDQKSRLPAIHFQLLTELRNRKKFTICYAGTHGLSDALDILIEAASLLAGQPIAFVLVGKGPDKARLQQRAQEMALDNVHFLDPVEKEAVPSLLACVDGLYIGWKDHALYRFGVSPNKLMDYMASGKPIVHATSATNDSVSDAGCGVSVEAGDAASIADACIRLMQLPAQERERMGAAGQTYVRRHHDYALLARKFVTVMSNLNTRTKVANG